MFDIKEMQNASRAIERFYQSFKKGWPKFFINRCPIKQIKKFGEIMRDKRG